jgi:cytoskeletal protein RodZ
MQNVGKWLQATREAREVSLDEVERVTRIRARYLKALEMGDYQAMPGGEPQARGFLRRYATFLGLSPDEAIARYDQEVHGRHEPPAEIAAPPHEPVSPARPLNLAPSRRNIWPVVAIVAFAVFVALVVWWLVSSDLWPSPSSEPTATSALSMGAPPRELDTTSSPEASVAPTFAASTTGVTLTLNALEHVWVRVSVDGQVVFTGLVAPDAPQTWSAADMVIVETGNGAGLSVAVNGQDQGPMCDRGEVCTRGWGPSGELTVPGP